MGKCRGIPGWLVVLTVTCRRIYVYMYVYMHLYIHICIYAYTMHPWAPSQPLPISTELLLTELD